MQENRSLVSFFMSLSKKKSTSTISRASTQSASHQVRIIGGQWKRSPLMVVDADGLRPTPDRVRETVFNWLTHLFHAHWASLDCLDLFAGTGALGFEAASRGARQVTMVEAQAKPFQQIQANVNKLGAQNVTLLRYDAQQFLLRFLEKITTNKSAANDVEEEKWDIIFLDPPFGENWLDKLLPSCHRMLKKSGVLYVEAEFPLNMPKSLHWRDDLPWKQDWDIIRADKAGAVYFHLLTPVTSTQ